MNFNPFLCSASAFVAAFFAVVTPAQSDPVMFYNWSGNIDHSTVRAFEKATGHDVVADTYGDANEAEATLIVGGSNYDLAVVQFETVLRLRQSGRLLPIDLEQVPEAQGVAGSVFDLFREADPELDGYALPYIFGTTGIAYDREAVAARLPDAPTDSWELIFDPDNVRRMQDCRVTIIDSMEQVLAIALSYLGLDPNSTHPKDIDAAFDLLGGIAPYVHFSDTGQFDEVMDRTTCLALTWSSNGFAPRYERGDHQTAYVIPKEGSDIWADIFVMPKDAEHPTAALAFLDHLLTPEVMAINAESSVSMPGVPAAFPSMDHAVFRDPAFNLSPEYRERLYVIVPRSRAAKRELDRRWRRLKLGLR